MTRDSSSSQIWPPRGLLIQLAAFVVVVAGLRAAQGIVVQALTAIFLAVVTAPVVFFLRRRGAPFPVALAVAVLGLLGGVVVMASVVRTSLTAFTRQVPFYEARVRIAWAELIEQLRSLGVEAAPERALIEIADPARIMGLAGGLFSGIGALLANSLVILLMVIFLLLEAPALEAKLAAAFGARPEAMARLSQLARSIQRYLAVKTWISLVTGAAAGLLCAAVGVDFALLWGLLAFVLNYIPNVGSFVAAIPPTVLAAVQLGAWPAIILVVGYFILNNVLGGFVEPRVMGRRLQLSTFTVLLSLLFWGWVLGPIGMLLSIPLTIAVKMALETDPRSRWIAILIGSGAEAEELIGGNLPLPPEDHAPTAAEPSQSPPLESARSS